MIRKALKNFISILLTALMLLQLGAVVFADGLQNEIYVSDTAGVLSSEDKDYINDVSRIIFEQTNCKFSVAAVDFLGGKSIEQYSTDLYLQNDMGSNGLLAVFSVAEENYYVIQGTELEKNFSNEKIEQLLKDFVEHDFESENYSKAIMAFYQAAAEELGNIYSAIIDPGEYSAWLEEQRQIKEQRIKEQGRWFAVFIASIALTSIFAVVMIVMIILRAKRKRKYTGY